MSRNGSIVSTFSNGEEYVFRLAWGELIKLQESRLCGPFVVLDRLHSNQWMIEDIAEVIRLGLIGGGMDEIKAKKLVREYVEKRPPMASHQLAMDVIDAGVLGPPDEEQLEKKVDQPSSQIPFPMEELQSQSSTVPAH